MMQIDSSNKFESEIQNVKIEISASTKRQIQDLSSRISKMKQRSIEIQQAIEKSQQKSTFSSSAKSNFLLKEKIQDYLFENDVLEKYLKSETFRAYDEAIIGYKSYMEFLRAEKEKFIELIACLEKEEK